MPAGIERFTNLSQSTLAVGIAAGDVSLQIPAGDTAKFPSSGNFTILIDSEIIHVGAVSGQTFSSLTRAAEAWAGVQAAAAHGQGSLVTLIWTDQSLRSAFKTKIDEQVIASGAPQATITVPFSGVLPTIYRHLQIVIKIRSPIVATSVALNMRFNGDTGSDYAYSFVQAFSSAASASTADLSSAIVIGSAAGSTAPSNSFASYTVDIYDYNSSTDHKYLTWQGFLRNAVGVASVVCVQGGGTWLSFAQIQTIQILPSSSTIFGLVTAYGTP